MVKEPVEPVELDNPVEDEDDTTAGLKPGDLVTMDPQTGKLTKVQGASDKKTPKPGHAPILDQPEPLDLPRNVVVATVMPSLREVINFALDNSLWFSSQSGPIHPEDILKALQDGKKLWQVLGVDANNPSLMQQMRGGDLSSVELVDPHRAIAELQRRADDVNKVVLRVQRRLGKGH